jgi:hypothetical protein
MTTIICLTVLLFACKGKKAAETQEEAKVAAATTGTQTEPGMDSATMMKNWQVYMTPGKEHQMMASWNGSWTGEVTMWMTPGAPPTQSKVITTNKMILGGRYQQATHKGSFSGMPFEGVSTLAFDNAKKVFISTWVDNMGTGIMVGEGPWDEVTKSITIKGQMVDPSNGKLVGFREIFKQIDKDYQVMDMYGQGPDGTEYKSMEIKYTRNK